MEQYAVLLRLLGSIDIGSCLLDTEDRVQLWNEAYLDFFPEHIGRIHAGEPYADVVARFFDVVLGDVDPLLKTEKVTEALERLRLQRAPFVFAHRGRRIQAMSVAFDDGRIRIWRDVSGETDAGDSTARLSRALGFPLDVLDHMADGGMVLDHNARIIAANAEFRRLYDVPVGQSLIGARFCDIVAACWTAAGSQPAPEPRVLETLAEITEPFEIELPGPRWRRVVVRRQASGVSYFGHSDITDLKRQHRDLLLAERRAREEQYRYRLIAENSNDVIVATEADLTIAFVSPAVTRVLGFAPEEMTGELLTHFVHDDGRSAFAIHRHTRIGDAENHATFTCRMRDKAGQWIWMEVSKGILPETATGPSPIAMVCSLRDVTERVKAEQALKLAHDELSSIAATDSLTGLSNRRRFDSAFDQEWRRATREGHPLCLMLIDIDHFKAVNDGHGHVVGDECLRRVADLISGSIRRPADLCARYGGEEFAIVLPQTPLAGAMLIAETIRQRMAAMDWRDVDPALPMLTVSIGLCCILRTSAGGPQAALRRADEALYRAKNTGRDRCEICVIQ